MDSVHGFRIVQLSNLELSPRVLREVRKSGRHLHKSVIGPGWKRPSTMFTLPKNKGLLFLSLETLVGFWAGLWFKPLQSLHHVGQGFAQAPPTSSRTLEILKNLRHCIQPASGEFHRPTPENGLTELFTWRRCNGYTGKCMRWGLETSRNHSI